MGAGSIIYRLKLQGEYTLAWTFCWPLLQMKWESKLWLVKIKNMMKLSFERSGTHALASCVRGVPQKTYQHFFFLHNRSAQAIDRPSERWQRKHWSRSKILLSLSARVLRKSSERFKISAIPRRFTGSSSACLLSGAFLSRSMSNDELWPLLRTLWRLCLIYHKHQFWLAWPRVPYSLLFSFLTTPHDTGNGGMWFFVAATPKHHESSKRRLV